MFSSWKNKKYKKKAEEKIRKRKNRKKLRGRKEKKKEKKKKKKKEQTKKKQEEEDESKKMKKLKFTVFSRDFGPVRFLHLCFPAFQGSSPKKWSPKRPGILDQGT